MQVTVFASLNCLKVIARTRLGHDFVKVSREIAQKVQMQELPFLHTAGRLVLIDIFKKLQIKRLSGFQDIERTRFVTDIRTLRQTPRENNMSPSPEGGELIHKKTVKNQ